MANSRLDSLTVPYQTLLEIGAISRRKQMTAAGIAVHFHYCVSKDAGILKSQPMVVIRPFPSPMHNPNPEHLGQPLTSPDNPEVVLEEGTRREHRK
jgi:hypothetical protein